ncbi:phage head closure protein [Anaerosporobacter sp.]
MLNINRLNKKISIYTYENIKNELGQATQKLSLYRTMWASVEPTTGREYYEAQKIRAELTWNIYTRYYKSFTPTNSMLIEYNNRKFRIISVIDYQERHEMYKFVCTEVVGEKVE